MVIPRSIAPQILTIDTPWLPVSYEVSCVSWTHWGRVMHKCVSKLAIIGSDNGLSPGQRQVIIRTSAGILLIGHVGVITAARYAISWQIIKWKRSSSITHIHRSSISLISIYKARNIFDIFFNIFCNIMRIVNKTAYTLHCQRWWLRYELWMGW